MKYRISYLDDSSEHELPGMKEAKELAVKLVAESAQLWPDAWPTGFDVSVQPVDDGEDGTPAEWLQEYCQMEIDKQGNVTVRKWR